MVSTASGHGGSSGSEALGSIEAREGSICSFSVTSRGLMAIFFTTTSSPEARPPGDLGVVAGFRSGQDPQDRHERFSPAIGRRQQYLRLASTPQDGGPPVQRLPKRQPGRTLSTIIISATLSVVRMPATRPEASATTSAFTPRLRMRVKASTTSTARRAGGSRRCRLAHRCRRAEVP